MKKRYSLLPILLLAFAITTFASCVFSNDAQEIELSGDKKHKIDLILSSDIVGLYDINMNMKIEPIDSVAMNGDVVISTERYTGPAVMMTLMTKADFLNDVTCIPTVRLKSNWKEIISAKKDVCIYYAINVDDARKLECTSSYEWPFDLSVMESFFVSKEKEMQKALTVHYLTAME